MKKLVMNKKGKVGGAIIGAIAGFFIGAYLVHKLTSESGFGNPIITLSMGIGALIGAVIGFKYTSF